MSDENKMTIIKISKETAELLDPWCDDKKHCDYGKAMEKFLIDFDKVQEEHNIASKLDDELNDEQTKILNNLDKIEKQLKRCLGAIK